MDGGNAIAATKTLMTVSRVEATGLGGRV